MELNRIKNHRMAARLALWAATVGNSLALPLASQAAAYTYTDLNPSGFTGSYGTGISGGRQVGGGWESPTPNGVHALLWYGTASSVVDLSPSGSSMFYGASGTSGSQQVGSSYDPATGLDHALLWSGTASSIVDLNPSGFIDSQALGVSGSQQVGSGGG